MACTLCKPGYYLENGNCINYLDKIKNIPHCTSYSYLIGNISFDYYPKDEYAYYDKFIYNYQYYYDYDLKNMNPNYVDFINDNLKNISKEIEGKCVYCNEGYFLNSNGDCVELTLSNCKLNEMIDNTQLYEKCSRLCS